MAWVRLHDGALSHPKVIGIFDPRRPFDLWIWGLSYSQAHLTDGVLPGEAIPKGVSRAAAVLVTRGLWKATESGYTIHDYLDWNDSKVLVVRKRSDAKERMRNVRDRSSRELLRGLGSVDSDLERIQGKPRAHNAGAAAGQLPRDHVSHAACDLTFSWCVPTVVHAKLVNKLAVKHDGDRQAAGAALKAWYPTVWASLPNDFVIPSDDFKFWQSRFDAAFASTAAAPPPPPKPKNCRHQPPCKTDAVHTSRYLAEMRGEAHPA